MIDFKKEKYFVGSNPLHCAAVSAKPMTLGAYTQYRGKPAIADDAPGYILHFEDGSARNHDSHEGHLSWMPSKTFEASYKEATRPK